MEKLYLKQTIGYHSCEKTIYYSEKDTALESNSIVYTNSNSMYKMYQIIHIDKDNPDILHCNEQGRIELEFSEAKDVDWTKVGVFQEGAIGQEVIPIERKEVHGKVLKVSSLLITCPNNVLQEK